MPPAAWPSPPPRNFAERLERRRAGDDEQEAPPAADAETKEEPALDEEGGRAKPEGK